MVIVIDAAATLLDHFGSGLLDAVAAPIVAFPVVRGLNVTVKVCELPEASELIFQVTTLCHHDAPLLVETFDNEHGNTTPTTTDFAAAGPEFFTVTVQSKLRSAPFDRCFWIVV